MKYFTCCAVMLCLWLMEDYRSISATQLNSLFTLVDSFRPYTISRCPVASVSAQFGHFRSGKTKESLQNNVSGVKNCKCWKI